MLNDWGIHHLHISTQVEADGFVRRDGPLLFVVFKPQAAYLVDIMQHGDWTRDHVLEVLASEWPNEGVIHEINEAVTGKAYQPTEKERATLRCKHVNASFEFGGKVFAPVGGMSAAGTTITATREADKLLDKIAVFERELTRDSRCLAPHFERHGLVFPDAPEFEFAIRVIETKTGAWVNLTGNQRP